MISSHYFPNFLNLSRQVGAGNLRITIASYNFFDLNREGNSKIKPLQVHEGGQMLHEEPN
jgi:hypothetical protein